MGETASAGASSVDDDLLLKNFFAEVSEVERDNEVIRSLSLSLSSRLCVSLCDYVLPILNCNLLLLFLFSLFVCVRSFFFFLGACFLCCYVFG